MRVLNVITKRILREGRPQLRNNIAYLGNSALRSHQPKLKDAAPRPWPMASNVQSVFLDSEEFPESRWFTRGSTLQELLAPSSVIFHNASWMLLKYPEGHDSYDVGPLMAEITEILVEVIEGGHGPLSRLQSLRE
ncbi:hypothetical protein BKA65DRAFT_483547 [Rhexocercosporidium sp. MPI-PUGE-AT-0058]|nr:hypothetical protein BKA65DRAFT_483547 [Rhexocercosporidium sp. MPI-PUGE-AT-0058]